MTCNQLHTTSNQQQNDTLKEYEKKESNIRPDDMLPAWAFGVQFTGRWSEHRTSKGRGHADAQALIRHAVWRNQGRE